LTELRPNKQDIHKNKQTNEQTIQQRINLPALFNILRNKLT